MDRLQTDASSLRAPNCPLRDAALLFFDIETTGLYPEKGAEITEIALLDTGGVRLGWSRDESPADFCEVLPHLVEHLTAGVVVGHHLAFDFRFVAYEAARRDADGPEVRYLDTLALARDALPERSNYRLESLVDALAIDLDGPMHTAKVDARACRALLWFLAENQELETLRDAGLRRLDWSTTA